MDLEIRWKGRIDPESLAAKLGLIPKAVDKVLGEKGEVLGSKILKEAKDNAPVDTGALRDSLDSETESANGVVIIRIGTDIHYAIFVEFGTRYMGAQPFLRPAIREFEKELERELENAAKEVFVRAL